MHPSYFSILCFHVAFAGRDAEDQLHAHGRSDETMNVAVMKEASFHVDESHKTKDEKTRQHNRTNASANWGCSDLCIQCPNTKPFGSATLKRANILLKREVQSLTDQIKQKWFKKAAEKAKVVQSKIADAQEAAGEVTDDVKETKKVLEIAGNGGVDVAKFAAAALNSGAIGSGLEMIEAFGSFAPVPGLGVAMKAMQAGAHFANVAISGCPEKEIEFCPAEPGTEFGPPPMSWSLDTYWYVMAISGAITDEGLAWIDKQRGPATRQATYLPPGNEAVQELMKCELTLNQLKFNGNVQDEEVDLAYDCFSFLCGMGPAEKARCGDMGGDPKSQQACYKDAVSAMVSAGLSMDKCCGKNS